MMTQLFNPHTMETQVDGVRPRRAKATVGDVVPTKDGYVGFAVVNRLQHWLDFCAMIGRPDWADDRDARLRGRPHRALRRAQPGDPGVDGERTTAEIVELATLMRIPCIEVGNGETIPTMDHFAEYGFYDANPDGGFLQPAPPFRMHPPIPGVGEVAPGPAPSARRSGAVDAPAAGAAARPPAAPAGTRPFAGLRVADFTSFWAGPFLAHTLGMFGADVIHVESTARPDGARLMNHHPRDRAAVVGALAVLPRHEHEQARRHARHVRTPRAGRWPCRLVAECDVIVENYSPRVMESWGLSWDDVRAVNPTRSWCGCRRSASAGRGATAPGSR